MDYKVNLDQNIELDIECHTKSTSDSIVDSLVEIRKQLGLSQQEVADAIGLPRANVSRIERKLYTPTLLVLEKYANGLGKTVKLSLEDTPNSNQS